MRLALALAVLVVGVGPGWAKPSASKCIVRVHKGAVPFMQNADNAMEPVARVGPYVEAEPNDDELLYVDTKAPGGPWIWRLREYAYKRGDVDLIGNCTHVSVE